MRIRRTKNLSPTQLAAKEANQVALEATINGAPNAEQLRQQAVELGRQAGNFSEADDIPAHLRDVND